MIGMLLRLALPVGLAYVGVRALMGSGSTITQEPSADGDDGPTCQFTSEDPKAAADEVEAWVAERLGGPDGINVGGGKLAKEYWESRFPDCPVPNRPASVGNTELWSVNGQPWKYVRDSAFKAINEYDPADPTTHNRRVARALLGYALDADV